MRFLILAFCAAAGLAYGADNSTSRILTCAKVSADAARLSCYDGVAKGLRASPPAAMPPAAAPGPAAAAPATAAPAPSGAAPARDFGLPPVKPSPVDEVKAVKATVTATHHRSNGTLIIELDNGQRWQQLGTADMGLQVGDSVTISRGLLGSFWLAPPSGRGSKVSRIQ
jgi:hypothetical protein